jgi:tRNA(fMet)-specific endonuclease VapC
MASYFLDTGILLGYVRGSAWAAYVDKKYAPSNAPNVSTTSVVCVGEINSLALRRNWQQQKKEALSFLLQSVPATPIRQPSIIRKFAEIVAFNHCQHPAIPNPASGRTMGDNDVWIASTASVLNATLLTTDRDFDHLNGIFLKVIYIDQSLTAADV